MNSQSERLGDALVNRAMPEPRSRRKDLSIGVRIYISFGIMIALAMVIDGLAYIRIHAQMNAENAVAGEVDEGQLYREIEIAFYQQVNEETEYSGTQEAAAVEEIAESRKAMNVGLAKLDALDLDADELQAVLNLKILLNKASAAIDRTVALVQAGDIQGAQRNHEENLSPTVKRITSFFDDVIAPDIRADAAASSQAQKEVSQTTIIWLRILGVVVPLMGLLNSYGASRSILSPIQHLTGVAEAVSAGDLDVQAKIKVNDEAGMLARVFNQMIVHLREALEHEQHQREYIQSTVAQYKEFMIRVAKGDLSGQIHLNGNAGDKGSPLAVLGQTLNETTQVMHHMTSQIREASNNLTSAAAEILAATTQQVTGATEQSASIAQTTTTMDEVKAIGEQAVLRAQEVVNASHQTVAVAENGQQMVLETINLMVQIKQRVESIADNILRLSEQTQQVEAIIAVVNDLADQSNMLALNAAIEAARAGEHGKGFGVVAAEVRSLAEQSRQATVQVKTILSEIQKATNTTVMATEEGAKVVDQGVKVASQTQNAIETLSGVIGESAQRASQVTAGGRQQTTGVEQIAAAMKNINQSMTQSLASTRQAERAAKDLNALALRLDEMVKMYTL